MCKRRWIDDWHVFASRLLLTVALVGCAVTVAYMYRRINGWRESNHRNAEQAEMNLANMLPGFPDFSGELLLNGVKVKTVGGEGLEVVNADVYCKAAAQTGWQVDEGLSKSLQQVSLPNSAVLQRGNNYRFVVPFDLGEGREQVWIVDGDAETLVRLGGEAVLQGTRDVLGAEFPDVPRPEFSTCFFSLLNDGGEGILVYMMTNDCRAWPDYMHILESDGWLKRAEMGEKLVWLSRENVSIYVYGSLLDGLNDKESVTVIRTVAKDLRNGGWQ